MQKLVEEIGTCAVGNEPALRNADFCKIKEQVDEAQSEQDKVRTRHRGRAADEKGQKDQRCKEVRKPVNEICAHAARALLRNQPWRLKDKIGQQVAKIDCEKSTEKDLHDCAQAGGFVRFRSTNERCEESGIRRLSPFLPVASNFRVLDYGKPWKCPAGDFLRRVRAIRT